MYIWQVAATVCMYKITVCTSELDYRYAPYSLTVLDFVEGQWQLYRCTYTCLYVYVHVNFVYCVDSNFHFLPFLNLKPELPLDPPRSHCLHTLLRKEQQSTMVSALAVAANDLSARRTGVSVLPSPQQGLSVRMWQI